MSVEQCCDLHNHAVIGGRALCCDTDDCGPCCAKCPTCPTIAKQRAKVLRDVVIAADRMRDHWAETEGAARTQLWTNLHTAVDAADELVYPL